MSKRIKYSNKSYTGYDYLINSPTALLVLGILAIALGILFICLQSGNKPISRNDASGYSGVFQKYETSKNYCGICFEDGKYYEIYPHTETAEFREKMESVPVGTKLYILVNPNNGYVVEIKTDNEEILNFDKSQQAIDKYDNGYIYIGAAVIVGGVGLMIFAFGMFKSAKTKK